MDASRITRSRIALAGLVGANLVWLAMDMTTDHSEFGATTAYGECRGAIRRERADLARVTFPAMDLIRVTRRGPERYQVRGYVDPAAGQRPVWYTCDVAFDAANVWRVDQVRFDQ